MIGNYEKRRCRKLVKKKRASRETRRPTWIDGALTLPTPSLKVCRTRRARVSLQPLLGVFTTRPTPNCASRSSSGQLASIRSDNTGQKLAVVFYPFPPGIFPCDQRTAS
jgi:hypothetical protein